MWDVVFPPRHEHRELPYYRAIEQGTINEERRLPYVGLTRARKHLYVTWARRRQRSEFLDEPDPLGAIKGTGRGGGKRGGGGKRYAGGSGGKTGGVRHGTVDGGDAGLKTGLSDDFWCPF